MFTTDSRVFLAIAAAAGIAASVFAAVSGDRTGALPLAGVALAAAVIGGLLVGRVVGSEVATAGATTADGPAPASLWPALTALAVVLFAVGLVLDISLLVLGIAAVTVGGAAWVSQAWAESAASARSDAREAGERVLGPATLPVVAFLAAAFVIVMMSRILLAVPKEASTVIAIAVAAVILAACSLFALAPQAATRVGTPLLLLGVLGLTVAGIVSAANGERTIHAHAGAAKITAFQTAFDTKTLELHAGGNAVIEFKNDDDGVQHNVAIYTDESAKTPVFVGEVFPGVASMNYVFEAPEPGTYFMRCDVHPTVMTAEVEVVEGGEGE